MALSNTERSRLFRRRQAEECVALRTTLQTAHQRIQELEQALQTLRTEMAALRTVPPDMNPACTCADSPFELLQFPLDLEKNNKQTCSNSPQDGELERAIESKKSRKPPNAFERWYAHYPRHAARGDAVRAFDKALKKASLDELIAAADCYAEQCRDKEKRFVCLPATWLNAERWTDEIDSGQHEVSELRPPTEPPPKIQRSQI